MSGGDSSQHNPVLLNTFIIKRKKCRVYFHRGILTWETDGSPYSQQTLLMKDVLAVDYVHNADKSVCCPVVEQQEGNKNDTDVPTQPSHHTSLIIHYAAKGPKNTWRCQNVILNHTDTRQIASWVKTMRNYLNGSSKHPKSVMVFVNPYGGKKKGLKIFEKQVKPLFLLTDIKTNVMITQGPKHAQDTLLHCSLEDIDAVVCVGGDGTFAEVFNGLVLRTAKDKGIDYNDPDAKLPSPFLPVGVIPSGSTDTMAYCFHGTTDVQTAVIHIIFGDTVGLDLCSIHSNAMLLGFYSSVISYGYLGDVIRDSEKFRWMGPRRYDYSGFKKFFANKGYEGEVSLRKASCDPAKGPKCCKKCERCELEQENNKTSSTSVTEDWKTFRGRYFMVNGVNVCCACERSPNGISPYAHLGDGCIDVLLIRHTHVVNNLRLLLTLTSKRKTVFDLPFVEVHRARELTFRALPTTVSSPQMERYTPQLIPGKSVWNCDGEVQNETDIRIRRIQSGVILRRYLLHIVQRLREVTRVFFVSSVKLLCLRAASLSLLYPHTDTTVPRAQQYAISALFQEDFSKFVTMTLGDKVKKFLGSLSASENLYTW